MNPDWTLIGLTLVWIAAFLIILVFACRYPEDI